MITKAIRFCSLVPVIGVIAVMTISLFSPVSGVTSPVAAQPPADMSCGSGGVELVGFSDALNKTTFGDFSVSELSGLTYDREALRFFAVADRAGPVQTHVFEIDMDVTSLDADAPTVVAATVLEDPDGVIYNGFTFDGEGIAMDRQGGGFYTASESGSGAGQQPEIRRFSSGGQEAEALEVPAKFLVGPNNVTFESLSMSPNGRGLFTMVERHLVVDGTTDDLRSRLRILHYRDGGDGLEPAEEYFYLTEPGRTPGDLGVAEVLAQSENHLLVLERGFVPDEGNSIKVFVVNLKDAEDVSGVTSLAMAGIDPVEKELLFDLAACPDAGATVAPGAVQPNDLLDNFEAMTFGPDLPGNRQSLVLLSDDNGGSNQTTRIVVLSVPER